MSRHLTNPVPGQYYDLATHGEPPEGVEVLWAVGGAEWLWMRKRSDGHTHWMLAPTPAPAVEEPPFPLSREEWYEGWSNGYLHECLREVSPELERWYLDLGVKPRKYRSLVAAWRAAGCRGAEPAEEAQESAKGPWRLSADGDGARVTLDGETIRYISVDNSLLLERLVRDANACHAEREARAAAVDALKRLTARTQEEAPSLRARERQADELLQRQDEITVALGSLGLMPSELPAAVRSLVERAEKAEAEVSRWKTRAKVSEEELREAGNLFTESCSVMGASWKSAPAAVRSLVRERDELRLQKQAVQAEFDTLSAKLANKSPRVRIFGDIGLERCKQDQKWGDQAERGDAVFCAILGEEFGEVCQAVLQEKPIADVREELIQTAAVAVQWVEILDRRATSREGR